MNLADSRMDCLRGCLATLSVLVVRIALLEYSKIHEKAYKCVVCEFGGFQNVLRDARVRAILHRESTDSLIHKTLVNNNGNIYNMCCSQMNN